MNQLIGQTIFCLGGCSLDQRNQGVTCDALTILQCSSDGINSGNHLRLRKHPISLGRDVRRLHGVHTLTHHLKCRSVPKRFVIRVRQVSSGLHGSHRLSHTFIRLWVVPTTHHRASCRDRLKSVVHRYLIWFCTTSLSFCSNAFTDSTDLFHTPQYRNVLTFGRFTGSYVHVVAYRLTQHFNHVLIREQIEYFHERQVHSEACLLLSFLSFAFSRA